MKIVTVVTKDQDDEIFEEGIEEIIIKASNGVTYGITESDGRLCIESSEKYMTFTPFDTKTIGIE